MIPIFMNETGRDMETAMRTILNIFHISADDFDRAANSLLCKMEHDPEGHEATKRYIDICKTNMTGNYLWS